MRTVFLDVDTQLDFLYPAGALYVPGAEHLVPLLAQLNHYAASERIPLICTMDAHTENDPEFQRWPRHCVAGTLGQRKPEALLLPQRALAPVIAPQMIVEKQSVDCFTNPHLAGLLATLQPERCVVYGVVTEICVLHAAQGLVDRGYRVQIVAEAVRELSREAADAMHARFPFVSLGHILSGGE
ncbi:MAG: cysteine hydrolase [Bryobacteraceae bacterium]|nr:cysteine hydrolase [Bryobacteraceae bacterium]